VADAVRAVAKAICGGGAHFAGLKPGASTAEKDVSFAATNKSWEPKAKSQEKRATPNS